jgi:hypothetical protein
MRMKTFPILPLGEILVDGAQAVWWTLKREATGEKRVWPKKKRPVATPAAAAGSKVRGAFVEVSSPVSQQRFELEVRGRRLHIPHGFDAQQLSSLLQVLESA